jgi:hypothetical protein
MVTRHDTSERAATFVPVQLAQLGFQEGESAIPGQGSGGGIVGIWVVGLEELYKSSN